MRIRLDLDPETCERLTSEAVAELRSVPAQALVTLRLGLGLTPRLPMLGRADRQGVPHEPS